MRRRPTARCSRRQAPGDVTAQERFAVATFVAGLHGDAGTAAFYAEGLAAARSLRAAAEGALTPPSRMPGRTAPMAAIRRVR